MLGNLYIVSAPSGAGKSSLIKSLLEAYPNCNRQVSISHTTRAKREGEEHGVHYYFVSKNEFESLIHDDQFLEYAKVFENYYGTSLQKIKENLHQGIDVFLDIDWQGARQVKEKFPLAKSIFILPPSLEVLKERLINRAQDSKETIEKRMQQAINEISHYNEYDYVLINDDFKKAREELHTILIANKLSVEKQSERHQQLLAQLLAK